MKGRGVILAHPQGRAFHLDGKCPMVDDTSHQSVSPTEVYRRELTPCSCSAWVLSEWDLRFISKLGLNREDLEKERVLYIERFLERERVGTGEEGE